jgi:GT2 family glycosyltransferase
VTYEPCVEGDLAGQIVKNAPIALFAYCRPRHTQRVLEALSRNSLSDQSELFVYCDGPPAGAGESKLRDIKKVREIVTRKRWCRRVEIFNSNLNLGLAKSIVEGVTKTVDQYGKAIVLEDDVVPSKGFLGYMNKALDLYENEDRAFQISAFMVPTSRHLQTSGFFRAPASWGWGTWKRAWEKYENEIEVLVEFAGRVDRHHFNLESTYPYYEQLEKNKRGELNTWCVRFYCSMLMHQGLCLYPRRSFVTNIGFGKEASNTKSAVVDFSAAKRFRPLNIEKIPVVESPDYYRAFLDFYRYQNALWSRPSIPARLKAKLARVLR